jgi:UDP-N-acetylglucosamine acyltransferase
MSRHDAPRIHLTAIISPEAKLAADVRVGPFVVIEGAVTVGPGCVIGPHAHLIGPLTIGAGNTIGFGSVIGGAPQHLAYNGETTAVQIGDRNTFREHTTVHRGMPRGIGPGTGVTIIGDGNLFMGGSHVAHDCRIGSHSIFANCALLAGHVEVGDRVLLSGNSAVHQFCRVGRLALLSGASATSKDIPPFWVMQDVNRVCGVNVIGMRRAGMAAHEIQAVRRAFKLIYREHLTVAAAVLRMEATLADVPAVREVVEFIRASNRGICGPGRFDSSAEDAAA